MTLAKTGTQIKVHDGNEPDARKMALKVAEQVGTPSLIWLLAKRHKVALLAIGNVILLLNWIFPFWTELVTGFFSSLF